MKKERQTFAKSFSTTEQTQQMLSELMEKHGLLSDSEAMRRSVAEFHKATFPDYIYKKSAKDIKAREAVATTKKIEAMDPVEFAEQYVPGCLIAEGKDGHQYMVYHGMSNTLDAIRDDAIKDWYQENPTLVEAHKFKVESVPVIGELSDYMVKYLEKYFGIIFPDGIPGREPVEENKNAEEIANQ